MSTALTSRRIASTTTPQKSNQRMNWPAMEPSRPGRRARPCRSSLTVQQWEIKKRVRSGCALCLPLGAHALSCRQPAKKLGIPCPSEWEDEEERRSLDAEAASKPLPVRITYPQFQHLKATDSRTGRSGLALILRAARGGDRDRVRRVVDALCAEADRKEEPGALRRMTEDYFDEILRTAAQRPMTPDEVIGYLDAKKRGYGGYAPPMW